MALNPTNNILAVLLFYGIFLLAIATLSFGGIERFWVAACFTGPLFIWSKYAFGREDGPHLSALMIFIFYLFPMWSIVERSVFRKLVLLLLVPAGFLSWRAMHTGETGAADFVPAIHLNTQKSLFDTRINNLAKVFDDHSKNALKPLLLPDSMRQKIGNRTVDIYPWESLIAAANNLHWQPRPVFQSYISYTPYLDGINQRYFDSDKAPDFVIWHYHSFSDIDTRFPLSSDPLTLQGILTHYHKLYCENLFCLWQREETDQLSVVGVPDATTATEPLIARWNDWISVPEYGMDVLRLHVTAQRTLAGKLNQVLWKEGGIQIDYRLQDDTIHTHQVVLDNAVSGLWISPYIDSFRSDQQVYSVTQDQLQHWLQSTSAEGYVESASIAAGVVRIYGWGILPFKPSTTQQTSLLLFNDKRAYRVPVQNKPRPGISEHFGKQGIVDLDSCGFDAAFSSRTITPDRYEVRFLVENEGATVISRPAETSLDITSNQGGNVQAVRLRTSRAWAFTENLHLRWSGFTLHEDAPWQ